MDRVIGWKRGEFFYDLTPAVFTSRQEVEREFVYGDFAGANLSKYLIAESRKGGKIAAFLKPCDSYSFVQLLKEHRIAREKVYAVGVACDGMCDMQKLQDRFGAVLSARDAGDSLEIETFDGWQTVSKKDVLLGKCESCKSGKIVCFDELLGEQGGERDSDRFAEVERLEPCATPWCRSLRSWPCRFPLCFPAR